MKKIISIDINEVLRDYINQFIKMYKKVVDPDCETEYDDVTDRDFFNIFPFEINGMPDKKAYFDFLYDDASFELYGRAEVMERQLGPRFSKWVENDMRNFDPENIPEIRLVSPFEMHLSIPSTLSFLARIGSKVRDVRFPIVSATIWDEADIVITADPRLLASKPEGKIAIKINAPYNKDAEADYSFDKFSELMDSDVINKLIENKD